MIESHDSSVTVDTLYRSLGLPDAPAIFDASKNPAERTIPTAARLTNIESIESTTSSSEREWIVYCESGDVDSRRAVDALRQRGRRARILRGGLQAWTAAGYATVKTRSEYGVPGESRWVTRERPKIDRLACPWLVRRFIDPDAQFFYTPAHRVRAEAEALGAQPYDIADVTFSHRGSQCSFDAFLVEFELRDPVLDQVATIVRAADTGELALSPQAHGLLAISLGMSANITDDFLLLEQAMTIYDALYAWCKSARSETHSWPKKVQ